MCVWYTGIGNCKKRGYCGYAFTATESAGRVEVNEWEVVAEKSRSGDNII